MTQTFKNPPLLERDYYFGDLQSWETQWKNEEKCTEEKRRNWETREDR